jgi:hypothetical protein
LPLRVKLLSGPADNLLAYLRDLGADARGVGADEIVVLRRHARLPNEPSSQDRIELDFIVRVWAREQPGAVFRIEEADMEYLVPHGGAR